MASKKLGTSIPWLVDDIDNRFKHALGNRPNSEFIISPEGKIVAKRAWSSPAETRKDLERLVGKPAQLSKVKDLNLRSLLPEKMERVESSKQRISRSGMQGLVCKPLDLEQVHYVKIRAEADPQTIREGKGKIYLGFHLDPIHHAKWNNLSEPLSYSIGDNEKVKIRNVFGKVESLPVTYDSEPREFLLQVEQWKANESVTLTVNYVACIGQECLPVQQKFQLMLQRDADAGGARGLGAGFWEAKEFTQRLLQGDRNGDSRLDRNEVMGLIRPHFEQFDKNNDHLLDSTEIKTVVEWLNNPSLGIQRNLDKKQD